jgi:aldose 1-epimerase
MRNVPAVAEDARVTDSHLVVLAPPGGALQATFAPRAGMVGCSLRHRGTELLHLGGGLREYITNGTTFGIPFLHPWANRLAGFDYFVLGKQVRLEHGSRLVPLDPNGLPIHGLLGASPHWEVDDAGVDGDAAFMAVSLDFGAYPALLQAFPFAHTVRQRLGVRDAELEITTSVASDRGVAVPISFGFHPYFRLVGSPRRDWEIELPVRERLLLDQDMIPTGERVPAGALDGPLGERGFDDGYAGVAHDRPFAVAGGGRRIEVHFDEHFPFAQVYSPPDADFICFEPMTAPTNALRSGEDLPIVQPGEVFTATWKVVVTQT